MGFAGAWRTEEVHDLGAPDEVELCQSCDPVAVEGGLEREVEALQRLDRHQLGGAQGDVDAASLPRRVFLAEQAADRLDGGELAALEPGQRVVERLQRARHPEPNQRAADTVEEVAHCGPPAARRRPTAS